MHTTLRILDFSWTEATINNEIRRYAIVKLRYSGGLQGESAMMMFPDSAMKEFSALERIAGQIGSKPVELYVQHAGAIKGDLFSSIAEVVSDSRIDEVPPQFKTWEMSWNEGRSEGRVFPQLLVA